MAVRLLFVLISFILQCNKSKIVGPTVMSDICLHGRVPSSHRTGHHPRMSRVSRGWWPHLRDRLLPVSRLSDETFSDHLLTDIGLSRADLTAFELS